MNFRWLELQETTLWGLSRAETAGQGENRESLRHRMWAESEENIPGQLCEGTWNQPGSTAYDGVWYGIWKDGRYMIAREEKKAGLEKMVLPAGLYAAFQTEKGGLAWEELPRMIEGLESWLPASGCRKKETLLVEVYHLRTDHDARKQHRYYEIWAPVEKE